MRCALLLTLVAGCGFSAGQAPADAGDAAIDVVMPTWSVDGTSAKGVPATAAEWQQLTAAYSLDLGAPDHQWELQETTGALADTAGTAPLMPVNLPTYRNAITGWSRLAVGTIERDGDYGFATGATGNLDGTDYTVLVYAALVSAPTAERSLVGLGAANDHRLVGVTSSGHFELAGSTVTTTPGASPVATAAHPLVVVVDGATGALTLYTDEEKLAGAVSGTSGLGGLFVLGSAGKGTANARYLYAAMWRARSSDAAVKKLLSGLGWSVTGY